jgi:ABC-type phosphate/phosphonate transport system substrate-binding protein
MMFSVKSNCERFSRPCTQLPTWAVMGLAVWLVVLGVSAVGLAGQDGATQNNPKLVRIGISQGTWSGVNRNDAIAAITAWAKTILGQRGIQVDVETRFFESTQDMAGSLKNGQIEAATMFTDEFLDLEPKIKPEAVFLAVKNKSSTEQYVILVHRSSGINDVRDLQGRKILLHKSPRTSLAPQWLETLLASRSMALADEVSRNLSKVESASKAVLQVFFQKADACVVTSNVFEMVSELNPQVRRELRVLASSPDVLPTLFCFRAGYTSDIKDRLEAAIVALHNTPAGQQILTVFQCDSMEKQPISCLEGTRRMLAEYDRLKRRHNSGEGQGPLTRVAQ